MSRKGTGYSYLGVSELSSAYCPICGTRTVHLPVSIAPRAVNSDTLCCSPNHAKLYKARIKAVCLFIADGKPSQLRYGLATYTRAGNLTVRVGSLLANLVDTIEITKGKVQLRKS